MHDIDTSQREMEQDTAGIDPEAYEGEMEAEDAFEAAPTRTLGPEEELDLANDLLEIESEEELDQFLPALIGVGAKLLPGIAKGIGSLFGRKRRRRRRAQQEREAVLSDVLGEIARTALGGEPSAGGNGVARAVGPAVGELFEAELPGAGAESPELERARRFVRLATTAAQKAALIPSTVDPRAAVQNAVRAAAEGLLGRARRALGGQAPQQEGPAADGQSGRWVRRRNRIVLYGV
ncbi:MAG: hypothetical protein KF833_18100 [Verrucomicrobiae bacterium]|nr:hypothetical protein [Verrucomicrobiae bacterium]